MKDFNIIRNIYRHPLNKKRKLKALLCFAKWQLRTFVFPFPVVFPFIENSVLVVEKGMTGATGNIYNGLHEYRDMLFLLHFLRRDDLFVDAGANIGSYTILASVNCGARTIAFEPVPLSFKRLQRNVLINDIHGRVTLFNNALGSISKTVVFTSSLDAGNHALSDGEVGKSFEIIHVSCVTLDETVTEAPDLIKIDVEGYESEVIDGGLGVFSSQQLKAVIIELNGTGSRYGFDDKKIHEKLIGLGFSPCAYEPFTRDLIRLDHWGSHNTIYIRDVDFVAERLKTARRIKVNNLIL